MDCWIVWDKGDFIGWDVVIVECDGNGFVQVEVMLEIDVLDVDVFGYELVWQDGKKVGFVILGGYGYIVGKLLVIVMVN